MGAWGPRLYQDDIAEDVRDIYRDQLHRGKTGKEITQMLLADYSDILSDSDDTPIFWFALADTQWNLGRLERMVKENALYYIQKGIDLKRWEKENPKLAKKRAKVLAELEKKLLTPQPVEKKISQYKLYQCEWDKGDVYAYPLTCEYAKEAGIVGEYFLFHKIGETTYWPGHIIPLVRVKITKNKGLPKNIKEFNELEYVQTFSKQYFENDLTIRGKCCINGKLINEYIVDEYGFLPEYRLELINTSKKVIPKNLLYIGNFKDVNPPELEYIPEEISTPGFEWKFFDKNMIERYCGYNLRKYKIYSK